MHAAGGLFGTLLEPTLRCIALTETGNRFGVLATPPPEPSTARGFHVPSGHRRSRNSRGTKEAKRRRDARRTKRKLETHKLNEQLSCEIDATLLKMNFFPQTSAGLPAPTSEHPRISLRPSMLPQLPPTPPQLPMLDFPGFNLNAFPEITLLHRTPTPPTTTPMSSLSSWCPALPMFTRNGNRSAGVPIFLDLSCLSEPKVSPKPERKFQELQLWRGSLDYKPKISRFFPPVPSSPKPKVKLPPTACKLHMVEKGLPDPLSVQLSAYSEVAMRNNLAELALEEIKSSDVVSNPRQPTPELEPSAANLWRILTTQDNTHDYQYEDPYVASFKHDSESDVYLAAWQAATEAQVHNRGPLELDSKGLPYVHANSLTGHTNEVALSQYADEHAIMADFAGSYTPLPSPPVGLNELMVDYDIGEPCRDKDFSEAETVAHDYPTPSSVSHTYILADILPVDCVNEDRGEEALTTSDAHFQSEQQLFELPPFPKSPAESTIDIAAFLAMGHAKNCWCQDCDKVPELIAMDKVTEMDADWTFCSATDDTTTATRSPSESCDEDKGTARTQCDTASDWEDLFPSTPDSPWVAGLMKYGDEGIGLGVGYELDWETEF